MKEFFKSEKLAVGATFFVIIFVQAPHLVWVFADISHLSWYWPEIHGLFFALGIDTGILYYAVSGHKSKTIVFMLISAAATIYYYLEDIAEAFSSGDPFMLAKAAIIIVIAIAPALLVYYNSEELADRVEEATPETPDGFDQRFHTIIQMKKDGHTYDDIQKALNINRTTISKAIKWYKSKTRA